MLPDGACSKGTTCGLKQFEDTVNLESDLIGKYVERLIQDETNFRNPPSASIQGACKNRD